MVDILKGQMTKAIYILELIITTGQAKVETKAGRNNKLNLNSYL